MVNILIKELHQKKRKMHSIFFQTVQSMFTHSFTHISISHCTTGSASCYHDDWCSKKIKRCVGLCFQLAERKKGQQWRRTVKFHCILLNKNISTLTSFQSSFFLMSLRGLEKNDKCVIFLDHIQIPLPQRMIEEEQVSGMGAIIL